MKSVIKKTIKSKLIFALVLYLIFVNSALAQSGWFQQISNTYNTLRSIYFISTSTGYAVGMNNTLFKTTNGGINWINLVPPQYNSDYYSTYFANVNIGYLVSGTNYSPIFKTTNGGINWITQNPNTPNPLYSLFFVPQSSGTWGYACGATGTIIKTTNGGNNWYLLTSGTFSDFYSVFFIDYNIGYVSGSGDVRKTTNAGQDWESVWPTYNGTYYTIFFTDANTGYTTGTVTMLKTTNAGQSWFFQNVPNAKDYLRSIYFPNSATGYTVGNIGKIYKTTNAGNNWNLQSSGTTRNLKNVFFINATTGWAVGDSGIILKTTDGGGPIGIIPIKNEIPKEFSLGQNYPNPFNASSKFKIQIAKLSDVKVVIYNVLGGEVSVLVNEQFKPGTYEVEFLGSNYPSGTYFYRLIAGYHIETRKMVLAR